MTELLGPLVPAANLGFRRTIPQMLGITFGFGGMVLAAGLGLAGVVHAEPSLHTVLEYAGAAYLLYLAWRIAHANAAGNRRARVAFNRAMASLLALSLIPVFW